jgi:hypothetical protein
MRIIQVVAISLILYCSFGTNNWAYAQEKDSKPVHHENHYHLSAFAGFTTDYKGKNGYKIGIEYEYRLSDYVGIGGAFDFTGADFEIFALSVGADFYPFKFPLLPGIMVGAKYAHSEWKPFIRAMLLYDFHIGSFSLGPMIMYDFFSGEKDIMSYGITVGYSLH